MAFALPLVLIVDVVIISGVLVFDYILHAFDLTTDP